MLCDEEMTMKRWCDSDKAMVHQIFTCLNQFFKGVQYDLPCSCIWNRTIFTRSESRGSTWPARLCGQLISCTAEWIFPDDLYCFAKWMINNATLVSKAGRGVNTGFQLLHHLQNVLKAYRHCFAVLSALDVLQYQKSSWCKFGKVVIFIFF